MIDDFERSKSKTMTGARNLCNLLNSKFFINYIKMSKI